jgi:hypothetical protein
MSVACLCGVALRKLRTARLSAPSHRGAPPDADVKGSPQGDFSDENEIMILYSVHMPDEIAEIFP